MLKRLTPIVAACLLIHALAYLQPCAAKTKAEKDAELAGKVKAGVLKLKTGSDARIAMKLRDKTVLGGYVSEAGDTSFTVIDKEGKPTRVAYASVAQVKGHNLSTGAKIAIGLGIAVAVLVILLIFENYG
jgi:hypothetical protein